MAKSPTAAERRHHARLRDMGCLICARPASIHHITSDGYKRITRDHMLVAPLCPECHQDGPHAIHRIGQRAFEDLYDCSLFAWASEQWAISNE